MLAVVCAAALGVCAEAEPVACSVLLTVTSELPCGKVPMDPTIDFAELIRQAGCRGVLDPNSIEVVDAKTDEPLPHALGEDFAYQDRGRLEWAIEDPTHRQYEIRFRVVSRRPPPQAAKYTPQIGTGDLWRYNAGVPRPIALPYMSRLVDIDGDGKRDLVGCWNYAHRPGWPWDGVVYYPRVGDADKFEFADLVRMRYLADEASAEFEHFSRIYMHADLADFDGDGRIDLVYSPSGGDKVHIYLNTARRDPGGTPVLRAAGSLPRRTKTWGPCRAVDLGGDGPIDLVLGTTYLRNDNPRGWPIELGEPVTLGVDRDPCFCDLDADGRLDAVGLVEGPPGERRAGRVAWRKNLGGDPPRFGPSKIIPDIADHWCSYVAAVGGGPRRGLLVQHDVFQAVSFYEQVEGPRGKPRFKRFGRAAGDSAVLALGDQSWPCLCDWDGDGDLDLLVGGGYGWPRILINEGSNRRPALAPAQPILSEGKPIRIYMSQVFPGCEEYKHNMGYPYPAFVDWDGDGLPDLMLPNCTNRIFWYKNTGTPEQPKFGPRRQLDPDGWEDSPQKRAATGKILMSKWEGELEENQPFFWRTGAGFADLNGDGLMDMITHSGFERKLTLFTQYRDPRGRLRLKMEGRLTLADGRAIDDSIVSRQPHWTESFRCVDWDGDGLRDVVYSLAGSHHAGIQDGGSIYLLRNCGSTHKPLFEPPRTLRCFGQPIRVTNHGPHPWVGDIDGDGKPDILTCVEWSVYPFYSHVAIQMKRRPEYVLSKPKRP